MRKTFMLVLLLVSVFALLLAAGCGGGEATPETTAAPATDTTVAGSDTTTATSADTTATTGGGATTVDSYDKGSWKFTFNSFMPPSNNISVVAEMWQAEITKRTNGAVEFEYLPGASLTTANKVYSSVVTGIADIGFSVLSATMGVKPFTELLDYPLGYPHGWVNTHVVNEFIKEFKPAELEDVHMFCFYSTGPQVLFTTKKPVRTLEDMKGMVIRSTGVGTQIAKALGAEGYGANQNEAYELMSKAVIDGSLTPREVLKGWKQAEVVKYVTQVFPIGSVSTMYLVMNKGEWADLPEDVQKVFNEVTEETIEAYARVAAAYDYEAMELFRSLGQGREVIDPSEEEAAKWKAAIKPLVDAKVAELQKAGLTDDYVGWVTKKIEELAAVAPSEEECAAWVLENVKSPSAK